MYCRIGVEILFTHGSICVEAEVQKREAEFSTFRDLNILICSWNTDAQKPEALTGSAENVNFLENVLHSVDSPDILVFGFQELIDLESRSLTASECGMPCLLIGC